MESRFTRGEFWLLETVVERGCPLRYLKEPAASQALNKPGHGLDRAALLDTLERLLQMGLIGFSRVGTGGISGPFDLRLDREEIGAALDERPRARDETYCGLTHDGGRQWEAFAAPNWERYFQNYVRYSRNGQRTMGVLISPDNSRVERLFAGARYMGHAVDHKHVHRRVLRPWRATYWKQLPLAYLVCYRFDRVQWNWEEDLEAFMRVKYIQRWCTWI